MNASALQHGRVALAVRELCGRLSGAADAHSIAVGAIGGAAAHAVWVQSQHGQRRLSEDEISGLVAHFESQLRVAHDALASPEKPEPVRDVLTRVLPDGTLDGNGGSQ